MLEHSAPILMYFACGEQGVAMEQSQCSCEDARLDLVEGLETEGWGH